MPNKHLKPGAVPRTLCLAVVVTLFLSGGCSLFRAREPAPSPLQEDFSLLRPEDFPRKIKQLEDISQNNENLAVRKRALFYIALAHMHYRNPSPDYSKAVQYLDGYISLDSTRKDIDEFVAWKSVVNSLNTSLGERERLARSYAQLKQQYDGAIKNGAYSAKVIENQKKEIEALKKTIKELDTVQQEIEKKRRGIKK